MVSGGCIISGATVRRSLLFSNVVVHSFAELVDSVVLPDVEIGRHARLYRTVIEKGCRIPEGMVVGENPEEDKSVFTSRKGHYPGYPGNAWAAGSSSTLTVSS